MQTIRQLRRLWVLAVFSVVISVLMFYLLPWSRSFREIVLLIGVGLYSIATLRVIFVKCPHCKRLFHNVPGFSNPFSRRCSHCTRQLGDDDIALKP